jgi:tetratricopeptide (TPR) repeat protein
MKRAGLVVVVIVGALSGVASAQESNVDPDADTFDLLAQAAARSHAGDHTGAIELYERAYRQDASMDLLVTIGSEYRKAGKNDEAIQNFCAYLAVEPGGDQAVFAAGEVFSIEASLGRRMGGAACSPAEPMLPPIAPPTVRQGPPTTNSELSQRELAGLATGAAGLFGLAAGVYFGVRANDISDQIVNHPANTPWPANIKDLEDAGERAETMQMVFMIGGAVATGAGVYLTVTGRSHRIANERITVAPALLQQGGGLAVSGGF